MFNKVNDFVEEIKFFDIFRLESNILSQYYSTNNDNRN